MASPSLHPHQHLRWTPRQRAFVGGALLLGAGLAWMGRSMFVGVDEATQLILAESLLSGSYRDEFLVTRPMHAQYPPGMSLFMALLRLVSPSLLLVHAANVVLLGATALMMGDALRRLHLPLLGATAVAAIALNPGVAGIAGTLRAEMLYMALTAAALWTTVAIAGNRRRITTLLLALAAFFTRSAGVSVLVAAVATFVGRSWRRAAGVFLGALTIALGWFAYTSARARGSVGRSYGTDMALVARDPANALLHAGYAAREHLAATPYAQFGLPALPGSKIDTAAYVMLLLPLVAIGSIRLLKLWPAALVNLAAASVLLLIWPWVDPRFMTPLVPWVIVTMLLGCLGLRAAPADVARERRAAAVAVVLAVVGGVQMVAAARNGAACRSDADAITSEACAVSENRDFVPAAWFVRDSLPASAVIATNKPAVIYLYSRRKTVPLGKSFRSDTVDMLSPAATVTHMHVSRHTAMERQGVLDLMIARCAEMTVTAELPNHGVILAPRAQGGRDACQILGELRKLPEPEDRH